MIAFLTNKSLKSEFGKRISSADVNLSLSKQKIQRGESVLEYMLKMKELASQGIMEIESVIQYIAFQKIMLYESRNFRELKDKLEVYARVMKRQQPTSYGLNKSSSNKAQVKSAVVNKQESRIADNASCVRCYNCGGKGHTVMC